MLQDSGGGLCLIATNLYQLFLHAGCRILERHNHSIDAYGEEGFFALGEDAAIAYGTKDLAIRNSFPTPVLLRISLGSHTVHSELFTDAGVVHGAQPSCGKCAPRVSWLQDDLSFSHYLPC